MTREVQRNYSALQPLMSDSEHRRRKGSKVAAIVLHFLGRSSLEGLVVIDVGCSMGFIAEELADRGATVIGVDIDPIGLAAVQRRTTGHVIPLAADSGSLPLRDGCADVVIFNHVYEHVVDPRAAMHELTRLLGPNGVAYLGLGNRLGVMEPHHRLPFLSWLPRPWADRYVKAFRGTPHYYERFQTLYGLRRLIGPLHAWDYSWAVITDPERFEATDMVSPRVAKLARLIPAPLVRLALWLVPTYLWIATPGSAEPAGASAFWRPSKVPTARPSRHP